MKNKLLDGIHNNDENINLFMNFEDNFEVTQLKDLHEKIDQQIPEIFELTYKTYTKLKTNFEGLESKYFECNTFELFEFIYYVIKESKKIND